jgi:3-hydroxy-9,10-secoandrosta-1,3,5(10)-triene-9,17-dione monooxygenase reductase component
VASPRPGRRVREPSLIELLARANHLLNESFCEQVKEHGLSFTEWRVLAALCVEDGVAMTALAELVLFKQPTLTKAIDRMERAQLVLRRTPDEDRRRTLVHLTERGRSIAAPLVTARAGHEAAVEQMVGEAASRELRAALSALIARVERPLRPARGGRGEGAEASALPD